jgi:hypothetical protein
MFEQPDHAAFTRKSVSPTDTPADVAQIDKEVVKAAAEGLDARP